MYSPFEGKGKIFTNVVTKKPVKTVIQTAMHIIHGKVHIRPDDRLKDEVNQSEPFIAVTDAIIFSTDGKELYRCNFLALNLTQIIWLIPEEEILKREG